MNQEITEVLSVMSKGIRELFSEIESIMKVSISEKISEKMWSKMPSYYVGTNFVRLIPFRDHINIEARAISANKQHFDKYKITPKGMLQIYVNQAIPVEGLKKVFCETLLA